MFLNRTATIAGSDFQLVRDLLVQVGAVMDEHKLIVLHPKLFHGLISETGSATLAEVCKVGIHCLVGH